MGKGIGMKLILVVAEGLGNVIQVLPLVNTLKHNNVDFDILNLSNCDHETVSWIFKGYAKVVRNTTEEHYGGRIEIATSKGVLSHSERLDIPILNDANKQIIYRPDTNEVETYLSIAKDLGYTLPKNPFDVTFSNIEEAEEFDFVIHNGCSLFNKAVWERKKYPHIEGLIDRLTEGGYSVASIGASEEFCGGANKTALSIKDSASLIASSKFYISNDTGTYHLAAAMKQPGIVLFTATSTIKNYHPTFHRSMKIVTAEVDCQPCQYKEAWAKCTKSDYNSWKCRDIPIDKIIKEIQNADIF